MGVVYLAEHERLKRKVALKVLAPELADDERFRDRFMRESELAASLDEPNVLPVYDAGEHDGNLFIAMRYVAGTDLRGLIDESPLALDDALTVVDGVARALDAAHSRGLVHRDIKPGNILVVRSDGPRHIEHVYLSDFGLTKRSASRSGVTGTGVFVGTLEYAAPEQFEGTALGPPTDVYSLGCVLFECLVGEPPFRREQDAAVMYAHLHDPPPSASAQRPELPGGVDQVIEKAMAKRPVDRFATAGELAAAFRDATTGDRASRFRNASSKTKPWLAVAGALIAIGVVLTILAIARSGGDPGSDGPSAEPSALPAGSLAKIDAETGEAALVIPDVAGLTRDADIRPNLAIGEGGVWMSVSSNPAYALLQHFDEGTGEVLARQTIPAAAHALAVGSRTVWFSDLGSSSVSRIDPASYEPLEPVSIESGFVTDIVLGGGRLWVGSSDGTLTAFDPLTGRRLDEIETQGTPDALAYGSGSVWALDLLASEVIRIDPSRPKRLGKISIPGNLKDIAAGEGGVWVFDAAAGTATEIDPLTEAPGPAIGVGPAPSGIAVGLGSAWVSDGEDGNLYRIDPELRRATPIPLGAPLAIVAIDDVGRSVWVGTFSTGQQV